MKTKLIAPLLLIVALAGWIAGCATGSPPNAVERTLFNTVTNYVLQTNLVSQTVPVYQTNQVVQTVTNQVPGQPPVVVTVTNEVTHTNFVTSQVPTLTNVPTYTMTPKPEVTGGISTVGTGLNTFFPGIGTMVGYGLAAIVGGWGYFRSSKLQNTSTTLAQETETILEFVGALPGGGVYVQKIKDWLQAHQNDTGAASTVLGLLENYISNPDAKVAAQQIINEINALSSPPAGTPTVPPVPSIKLV